MGNADDEIITNGDASSQENGNDSETADFVNVEKDKILENGDLLQEVNLEDHDVNNTNEAVNIRNENAENEIKMELQRNTKGVGPDKVRPADNYYTTSPSGCVKIRNSYEINEPVISVPTLLTETAKIFPSRPAIAYREGNEDWNYVNYTEYLKIVRTTAKAFLKLGLERYHSVCILGMNSPEWFYSDLGAIFAGGFAAGIYTTNSPDACLHCLTTSNANIVVVENEIQLQKILQVKDKAPLLRAIIQYAGKPSDSSVLSWNDVIEIGEKESDEKLDQVIGTLAPNECCSLLYTSGTISLPKAVMLSHDNLVYNTKMASRYLEMIDGEDRICSYLPLSHAAAQTADLYMGIVAASCVYFADKNVLKGTMVENLKAIRPTILFGVPRVWEKIREGLELNEKKASRVKQYLLSCARSAGLAHYKDVVEGYVGESFFYKLYKRIVYGKVKDALGFDTTRTFLSGAAPLPIEVKEYLAGFDMPITEAYGMSECCGAHVLSKPSDFCFNATGRALPGTRTKIDQPNADGVGEVCMFGRHVFMGYLNDNEKTEETLDSEGWLHSGDLGQINGKEHLQITGRIKELIITAGGENIAPALIELVVKTEIPVVSQAVVIGDGKKFLSLLITLKSLINLDTGVALDDLAPETKAWVKSLGLPYDTVSEIVEHKPSEVYASIQTGLERVNAKAISSAHRIQKFTILPKDFSLATGELGPTMKVMKRVVFDKYQSQIEKMYA